MRQVLCLVVAISLLSLSAAAQTRTIVVGTGEWAPYTSEKLDNYGFFSEIVSAAAKEAGLNLEIKFFPWKRGENMAENGQIFAVFPYIRTADREKVFLFSDPVAPSKGKFFYLKSRLKGDLSWTKPADLKPYTIGGVVGYWYEKEFKAVGLDLDMVFDEETNFTKLKAGRIDLAASEELVGWQLITKLFPNDKNLFTVSKQSVNVSDMMLMVSRTYPDASTILILFNDGLKKLKANGKYAAILKKYHLGD